MKIYIVKNHTLLANYRCYPVIESPWRVQALSDLSYYYSSYDDSDLYVTKDLLEDDLLILTLSGHIVEQIKPEQLSRYLMSRLMDE